MSQASLNVPTTGPSPPATFAGIMNGALDAVISKNSGGSAPANFPTSPGAATAFQDWADTSPGAGLVDEREYDGANWLNKGAVDQTNHVWMPKVGGGSGTIVAAATTNIGSVRQSFIIVSGAVPGTPITSFGNNALLNTGESRFLYFSAAGILTYNGASMILPGAADLSFNVGDTIQALYLGGGNWICFDYRSNVSPIGRNTGDVFDKWQTGASAGAVRANGLTVGNGASGATERANADTVNLFIFLYLNDTSLTVSGGRSGSTRAAAITDFNLNKTIAAPDLSARGCKVVRTPLTSGSSATFNTQAFCKRLMAYCVGGGGGGGAATTNIGGTGTATTFNGVNANPGGGGGTQSGTTGGTGGDGGTGGTGGANLRLPGSGGGCGIGTNVANGSGTGAPGLWGFGGGRGGVSTASGVAGGANTGAGGSGGCKGNTGQGGGGGAGEYIEVVIASPATSYTYTVGAGGTGGGAGGNPGGDGGSGLIIVDELVGPTAYLAL